MMELTVARVEAQGGADLLAREGDVRWRRWWARRLVTASQVAPSECGDLAHGSEQGGPDASRGLQQARLRLNERRWVPGAGSGLVIFRAAPGTTRFGRFAAIAVSFHLPGRGEGEPMPACRSQCPLSDPAGEALDE